MTIERKLRDALRRAEDGAGTMPAKEAVKLRPADWHQVCDLSRTLLSEIERLREALERVETIAKDRSEKALYRLDMIADEAHYAVASRALTTPSNKEGGDHG